MHALHLSADWLVQRGWTEANAGNMSVRLDWKDVPRFDEKLGQYPLMHPFPSLDGNLFLVTATKSRARDIPVAPEKNVGLYEIADNGQTAICLWGAGPPTSEFPAHLAVHAMCGKTRPAMNAVLHTHPPNLIAIGHLPDMQLPGALNKALRQMHPKSAFSFRRHIICMASTFPDRTARAGHVQGFAQMQCRAVADARRRVARAQYGDSARSGRDSRKAAMIYLLVLSTGQKPVGPDRRTNNKVAGILGNQGQYLMKFLAIDIGASGGKAVLGNSSGRN